MLNIDLKNILIFKPSSIGDIIHALPFLKAIRVRYPDARISWLVNRGFEELIQGSPHLNEVILFERKRWGGFKNLSSKFKELADFITGLRNKRFDAVIDLQGLFRSGIITYLSGARHRIGFGNARELSPLFYNHKFFPPTEELHAVDRYLLIAKEMGANISRKDFTINIPEAEIQYINDLIGDNNSMIVALNPSARWQTKIWPVEKFAELADTVASQLHAQTVLFGSREDVDRINLMTSIMKSKPLNLAGKTNLLQLAALLKKADILVTNDSGPMHIAAALKTPVVALFGSTRPKRTGPYGRRHVIIQKEIACSGCLKKRCNDLKCMDAITVYEVFNSVKEILKPKRGILK